MDSTSIESKSHHLEEYRPPAWITPKVSIRFDLDFERTLVRAEYQIRFLGEKVLSQFPPLFLDGIGLHLISIRLEGVLCEPSSYRVTSEGLTLHHPPSSDFSLIIENVISPKANTALEGLYQSGSMLCTQNEPEGFRKIVYSIDRPDNLTVFTVTLCGNVVQFPVLLSNGNLVSSRTIDSSKHESIWFDPFPKPSYLFAIVAGKLTEVKDSYLTKSGRLIDLKIFVDEKNKDKTEFAMTSLKEAMLWDEETFGLEYDLDLYMIVAVDDFNMGAMENKGLNLFNSKLVLADKKSATDETFESILGVVAHEYFHNWTGNRVTLRNWFNLTLKEGLTVFRDQWFTEDKTDICVKRIKDVLFLKEHQFQEDAGPMSHPILPKSYKEMNNFYTVTVYEKGAEVIRMLSLLLGRELFKKGLVHYLKKYDGTGVTYEEFISSMEEVSGRSFLTFRNWYHRKGTPMIEIKEDWSDSEKKYTLTFVDKDVDLVELTYPMSIAFLNEKGDLMEEDILEIKGKSFQKSWSSFPVKPIVSLQRGFSAPIKLCFDRDKEDNAFLAKYEKEGVSRFFALQEVIHQELKDSFVKQVNLQTDVLFSIYEEIFSRKNSIEKDFLSYLLSIPSLSQISEVLSCYEFELVESYRQKLIAIISHRFSKEFENLYMENCETIPIQSRQEIGKRRLKNLSLFYQFHNFSIRDKIAEVAISQQIGANHMSEELAVLRLFCDSDHQKKEESIALFFQKWKENPLVLDYWFSAQVSFGSSALTMVQKLLTLPTFHWENPNRVRALIGAFARNPRSFHKVDGSGYKFLASALSKLNAINPQIASNLGKIFQSAVLQSADKKEIVQREIKKLLELKDLSNDLEEVLSKISKGL